jgi:serine/threonine-protein kinase
MAHGAPSPTAFDRAVPDRTVFEEGARFGSYVLGPCIGEGGMARVYRAEHEGLQRQVALKVLLDGLDKDSRARERFLREGRIAAAIKHPNVVNIFDVGVHQGTPYLVMELLEGQELGTLLIAQGALAESTLMDVIIPIVAGLAAVHEAGTVHRDLKPGNIFLARGRNDEIEPKLLDFGISKSLGAEQGNRTSSHSQGLRMGTPFYMAPEALQGREMTPLSDQYSLGVVLYECGTGTNPFSAAHTFGEVVQRATSGDYVPVSQRTPRLSRRMVAIIERAMQIDPARRFPDMRAMGRELLQVAGHRTRITWGLSFSEVAGSTQIVGTPLRAEKKSSPPRAKSGLALPALLGGVAAVGLAWAIGSRVLQQKPVITPGPARLPVAAPSQPGPPAASPARSADQVSAPLRPAPSVPEPALPATRAADPVVAPKPAAVPDVSSAPRREASRPRPAPAQRARRAAVVEAPVKKDVREEPAQEAAEEEEPDWVSLSRRRAQPPPPPDHGTNNALILD